jgi:hypothetical protein
MRQVMAKLCIGLAEIEERLDDALDNLSRFHGPDRALSSIPICTPAASGKVSP